MSRAIDPEQWQAAKSLFAQVLERPREERERWLESSCADLVLREEVLDLLAHHDASGGVLATTPGAGANPGAVLERLGAYRIVRLLGRGGMGVVYLAEQDNPRRTVALKVIQPLSFSPQAVRRFEHEAQLLARLSHPGIAQIYEAGTDGELGTPFFAMELVEGVPLTEYARAHDLSMTQRVELFASVCDAVQHAHQKGVIHRDLKPSNILVDASMHAKVLDFGVARATDEGDGSMRTAAGQLVGTLHYMSPEQIAGDTRDLDTRSDVYALGVVLYELLAARLPYELDGRSVPEAGRVIVEQEPRSLAENDARLRGDLETIAAKALEKDRARRYASASDLALDLRRFLRDEPIAARPASAVYTLRKFARRNRVFVGGVAATLVALVLGFSGTAWQAVRATEQRDRAVELKQQADDKTREAELAREELQREVESAYAVLALFTDILGSPDPNSAGREVRVMDQLEKGVAQLDRGFEGKPGAEAAVRHAIAKSYQGLGLLPQAEVQARRAYELFQQVLGPDSINTVTCMALLGTVLYQLGKYDEALPLQERAEQQYRKLLGDDAPDTARAVSNLTQALYDKGEYQKAIDMLTAALAALEARHGKDVSERVLMLGNLGMMYRGLGDFEKIERYLREALELREKLTPGPHPERALVRSNLAMLYQHQRRLDEAVAELRGSISDFRALVADGSPELAMSMINLASLLRETGELDEAVQLATEAVAISRQMLPADHPDLAVGLSVLGAVTRGSGNVAGGIAAHREALDIRRKRFGEQHADTLNSKSNLSRLLTLPGDSRDLEQALPLYQELLEALEQRDPPEPESVALARAELGHCLAEMERYDEAEPVLLRSHDEAIAAAGEGSGAAQKIAGELFKFYAAWKKPEQADAWRDRAPAKQP